MTQPVFISHSSLDKDIANQICEVLEALGVACWIAPRNVPPGARYGEAIFKVLESTSAVVLVLSEHANASEQVMNEVERALSNKKEIFPLKIDDVVPSPEMNYFIGRRHRLDATSTSLEASIEQLAEAVKTTATEGAGTAATPDIRPQPQRARRRQKARAPRWGCSGRRRCRGGDCGPVAAPTGDTGFGWIANSLHGPPTGGLGQGE